MQKKNDQAKRNIVWAHGHVTAAMRQRLLDQRGVVLWLTGLSGSGKSTIAQALEERLIHDGHVAYVLDGDNIRHGLNADLTFSPGDRQENIRRIGEVAALFADAGIIAVTAFISPYREDRDRVRAMLAEDDFVEIYLDVPLTVCEKRDPKKLYQKARAGEISDFTGIDAPYEPPESPEIRINTSLTKLDDCVTVIVDYLTANGYLFAQQ